MARGWPSPVGLLMGLAGVLIAQVLLSSPPVLQSQPADASQLVLLPCYAFVRLRCPWPSVQEKQPPATTLLEDVVSHATAPGSFLLVYGYI